MASGKSSTAPREEAQVEVGFDHFLLSPGDTRCRDAIINEKERRFLGDFKMERQWPDLGVSPRWMIPAPKLVANAIRRKCFSKARKTASVRKDNTTRVLGPGTPNLHETIDLENYTRRRCLKTAHHGLGLPLIYHGLHSNLVQV